MTEVVVAALKRAGRPMKLAELEDAVRKNWTPTVEHKRPNQIRASISALPHKSTRIKRVGRGVYDLTQR